MPWTYITGIGPPQGEALGPGICALVASSIELQLDHAQPYLTD